MNLIKHYDKCALTRYNSAKMWQGQDKKAILLHLTNFGEEMLTLTKRELMLLNQAQPDYTVYLTETEVNEDRWWAMHIEVPSQNTSYEVVTALGKTKLWR